jgi:hypothetical protein
MVQAVLVKFAGQFRYTLMTDLANSCMYKMYLTFYQWSVDI